jgi:hypothetical protein
LPGTQIAQHTRRVRPAVDQVADEHRGTPVRVNRVDRPAVLVADQLVAQAGEQDEQLGAATVHVADDVERPGDVALVVEQLLEPDGGRLDLVHAAQHVHLAEALPGQLPERTPQVAMHPAEHLTAEQPVRPGLGACPGHRLRHVQHDRHRQYVVVAGDLDQPGAGVRLQVGGVHHGQPPGREALAGHVVQHLERVGGRGLIVLVVRDQPAEVVRGQHLGRPEEPAREGGLAGAGDADQRDQREFRDVELGHAASPF